MSHKYKSGITVGVPAWHNLDTNINPLDLPINEHGRPYLSTAEAMRLGKFDYEVGTEPLYLADGRTHPTARAIVNLTDGDIYGKCGLNWTALQNSEAFGAIDPYIRDGSLSWESCCVLSGGAIVTLLARVHVDAPAEVVPGDEIRPYVLVSNAHTGDKAAGIQLTATRVVCANTHAMAQAAASTGVEPRLRLYHRKNIVSALNEGVGMIDFARRTFAATVEQYRRLAGVSINKDDLYGYVRRVFDVEDGAKAPRAWEKIEANAASGRGTEIGEGVTGTLWGAFNAITEWVDHDRGRDATRLHASTFGEGKTLKGRAFDLAGQMAE